MAKWDPLRMQRESWVSELLFFAGAALVIGSVVYSVWKAWPSLDPLAMAVLVGIGLLLVVVCERLGMILREIQAIGAAVERRDARREEETPP